MARRGDGIYQQAGEGVMAPSNPPPPYCRSDFCEQCRPKVEAVMAWLAGRPSPADVEWLRRQLEELGK